MMLGGLDGGLWERLSPCRHSQCHLFTCLSTGMRCDAMSAYGLLPACRCGQVRPSAAPGSFLLPSRARPLGSSHNYL